MGASRSKVASSAASETSMPDICGCGTDVSVLIAPLLARERACHPSAPSCSLRTQAGYRHQRGSRGKPSAPPGSSAAAALITMVGWLRLPYPRPHRGVGWPLRAPQPPVARVNAPLNTARIPRNVPVTPQIWETGRVSSQGRRRNLPPGSGRSGHRRVPRPSPLPAPPPNALFAEMLRAARELLAVRSPLDAELMVSELLGTWWGEKEPGAKARNADLEELLGEGLVAYAAEHESPAALALLSGIACLGTPRQAAAAECAALVLIERGIKRPGWAEHVGAVAAGDCYVNSDAFGDRDEAVCLFSYGGTEPHALVLVVDYNSAGMLSDGWVTSQVDTLLERCRDGAGRGTFRQVAASQARHLL